MHELTANNTLKSYTVHYPRDKSYSLSIAIGALV